MPRGTRPRAKCPWCGRSTAVTFNKRTGEAYLRTHNDVRDRDLNAQCVGSRRVVERSNFVADRPVSGVAGNPDKDGDE